MSPKWTRSAIGSLGRAPVTAAPAEPARNGHTAGGAISLDLRTAAVLLSLVGATVSIYLSAVELSQGQVPLACANSGLVNCDLVTSSAQSRMGGVPVAFLGVVWFAGMLGLLAFEGRLRLLASPALHLVWTGGGVLMVFYLIYAELFLIGALCVWCTVVHVVVIGLFLLAVARAPATAS